MAERRAARECKGFGYSDRGGEFLGGDWYRRQLCASSGADAERDRSDIIRHGGAARPAVCGLIEAYDEAVTAMGAGQRLRGGPRSLAGRLSGCRPPDPGAPAHKG